MLPFKKIICPTDFSEPSYEGLQCAAELVSHFSAELIVVHVVPVVPPLPPDPNFAFEVPEYERALHAEAERTLNELVEQRISKDVNSRTVVAHGDAADEVVRLAREEGADLIVIATHGLTGWRHFVFGSVAEKVVRMAECPVLTCRAPRQ
ncbi:MAG: universal stress protein [Acidobacteria bacterium]|nr:universal stress protein [Acidobacteriota bacterium]